MSKAANGQTSVKINHETRALLEVVAVKLAHQRGGLVSFNEVVFAGLESLDRQLSKKERQHA